MSDSYVPPMEQDWTQFMERWNQQFLDSVEQNMEAQAEFVEAWTKTVEDTTTDRELAEGVQGYARAYEAWMDAAQQMMERTADAVEGEDVQLEEFRDIWLNTANEAFKEVMSTSAFAAMTGETVQDALQAQQEAKDMAEDTLHTLGFATESDVVETGERLVELERRQHAVEEKLDRVLDALEE